MDSGGSGKIRGDLVRTHRARAGLTQPVLAARANISERALRDIEQNRVVRPHPSSLNRIADALKLSAAERAELISDALVDISVSILGPLRISLRGKPLTLTSGSQQLILGLLALEADRFVTLEEMADMLWDGKPSDGWRNRIHLHLNQIRQLLEPSRLPRQKSEILQHDDRGYRLHLPGDQLDAARFRRLFALAENADPAAAAGLWHEALSCWRGPVLHGDDGRLSGRPTAEALMRARLAATLGLADAATVIRQPDQALVWLRAIADEEPLHEGIQSRLMIALAASGQQDRALGTYRELSKRLAEELGVDPTAETQSVYRQLLEQGAIPGSTLPARSRPAQMPATTILFSGRDDDSARLIAHLTGPSRSGEIPAPRIVVLHGMPGVGKTSLALHVAHRIKHRYPDGQLFADLRGEREEPANPAQILASFLRALGVAPFDIPAEITDRSATLRTQLAGKRMLLVFDDARSAAQVLPLLPSDSGNDVLITSRNPLAELPVTRHRVEPMTLEGSLSVLSRLLPQNLSHEAGDASRLAALCAGLPLALSVAAGRVHNGASLAEVAELLSDERTRVSELHSGQLAVNSSLESLYSSLKPIEQQAFRQLARLPVTSLPHWTLEALNNQPSQYLDALADAHLISLMGQRYVMHDLVKLFGAQKTDPHDGDPAFTLALHYFNLAEQAAPRLTKRRLHTAPLGIPAVTAPAVSQIEDDVHGWFERELPSLLDMHRYAVREGHSKLAAGLLNVLVPYLTLQDLADEIEECVASTMLSAVDDPLALAYAYESAARVHIYRAKLDDGVHFAETGLEMFEKLNVRHGYCQMLYHLQYYRRRLGRVPEAIELANTLAAICQEMGDIAGEAAAFQALGIIHREYLDDLEGARRNFEQAMSLVIADPTSKEYAQVAYGLAFVYSKLNMQVEAEKLLSRTLTTMRAIKHRIGIVTSLNRLADIWPPEKARAALDEALEIALDVGQKDTTAHVHEAFTRHFDRTGDRERALAHARAAMETYRRINAANDAKKMAQEIRRLEVL